jgi:hypothetical protein
MRGSGDLTGDQEVRRIRTGDQEVRRIRTGDQEVRRIRGCGSFGFDVRA